MSLCIDVDYCIAGEFVGRSKSFDNVKKACKYACLIRPYVSYLHIGTLPENKGVGFYPNPSCDYGFEKKVPDYIIESLFGLKRL